jgi:hypothetical protein
MFLIVEAIENNKETIIIFVLALVVIIGVYLIFFAPKKAEKGKEDQVIKNSTEDELRPDVIDEPFTKGPEDLSSNQDMPVVGTDFQNPSSDDEQTLVQEQTHQELERVEPLDPKLKETLPNDDTETVDEEPVSENQDEEVSENEEVLDEKISDALYSEEDKAEETIDVEEETNTPDKEDQDSEEKTELGKYHVLYRKEDSKWYVKREGSEKVLRVLQTQQEAIAWATIKALNQDTTIVIHKRDGKIRKQNY